MRSFNLRNHIHAIALPKSDFLRAINYDLPWNPRRIEQWIGRCHRYGQRFDVVGINFLNTRNQADQRVLELLIHAFTRAVAADLLTLTGEGRQFQGFEVIDQQYLRGGGYRGGLWWPLVAMRCRYSYAASDRIGTFNAPSWPFPVRFPVHYSRGIHIRSLIMVKKIDQA